MRFNRHLAPRAQVDLIPMIDVVFQLVIFFMVSSTFLITPGIRLALPQSETSEPVAMTKIVVTVKSEEEVYLNKDRYSLIELDEALDSMKREEKTSIGTVVIEGDRDIPYNLIVQVLDVLRRQGFQGVNLRMEDAKNP